MNLHLIAQCMPFIAQKTGKTIEQAYAMGVVQAHNVCGEEGIKLLHRVGELKAKGASPESALSIAELCALEPLMQLFAPSALAQAREKISKAA